MTGIERLRELVDGIIPITALCGVTKMSYDVRHMEEVGVRLRDFLDDIADQIEREQDERVSRTRVLSVVTDMERHILGHEGMDDSPVARWARELRGAMGGRADEEVEDVATVRADAMEAWRWVREHGGIEGLIRVLQDADSRRVELCAVLGIDLDKGWSEAMAAMRLRLMPEGYEWPRYEGGPLLRYGDSYIGDDGNNHRAWQIRFDSNADVHVSRSEDGDGFGRTTWDHFNKGERVRRPAVLAADGKLLEAGQTVWHVDTGDEFYVSCFSGGMVNASDKKGGGLQLLPSQLTHTKPEPPDSWERVEEDAERIDETRQWGDRTPDVRDLVRRCKALAERERGE